jgi:hypothetical protein
MCCYASDKNIKKSLTYDDGCGILSLERRKGCYVSKDKDLQEQGWELKTLPVFGGDQKDRRSY